MAPPVLAPPTGTPATSMGRTQLTADLRSDPSPRRGRSKANAAKNRESKPRKDQSLDPQLRESHSESRQLLWRSAAGGQTVNIPGTHGGLAY